MYMFNRRQISHRGAAEGQADYTTAPSSCPAPLRESTTIAAIVPQMSGLSGPSYAYGQDRKPAHNTDISVTINNDRNQ